MKQIKKHLQKHFLGYGFTFLAIIFNVILLWLGSYDSLEQNLYDYRLKLRGPLSGDFIALDDFKDRYNQLDKNKAIKFDYTTENNVVIIGLDQESYENIGRFYPYNRGIIWAKVVDNLVAAKVEVIVFDIMFDKSTEMDSIFSKSLEMAKKEGVNVILAAQNKIETNIKDQNSRLIKPSLEILSGMNSKLGLVGSISDKDGFIRRYITFDNTIHDNYQKKYYSLAIQTVASFTNKEPVVSTQGVSIGDLFIPHFSNQNTFLINYIGPNSYGRIKTFNSVPLYKVLDDCDSYDHNQKLCYSVLDNLSEAVGYMDDFINQENRNDSVGWIQSGGADPFKNKIAIIGSALKEQHDVFNTPFNSFYNSGEMYGIEVHANAIQQILDNNHINVPLSFQGAENNIWDKIISLFITVLVSISIYYIITFFKPITSIALCVLFILILFNIAMGAFINDYLWILKSIFGFNLNVPDIGETVVLPIIYPVGAIVFSYAFNLSFKVFTEQRDKKFFQETFGQYISPDLIDQMFSNNQRPTLGGESGIRTAFFTDIQGFSKIAESLSATKLVELLNEYLSEMTSILINNKGTLDKYEGDAILAIFGAPVAMDNHAEKAIDTAIKMQIKLKELNVSWINSQKWPDVVHNMFMRIGISSGDFVVGNMGSTLRMDYTMMGDIVNVAARLESAAKIYGIGTNCDIKTLKMTNFNERYIYRYIDKVLVVGKSEPIEIVEILDFNHSNISSDLNKLISFFDKGMKYYKKMEWTKALEFFNKSLKFENFYSKSTNNPSKVFIKRCNLFQSNPPPSNWDGIFKLESK